MRSRISKDALLMTGRSLMNSSKERPKVSSQEVKLRRAAVKRAQIKKQLELNRLKKERLQT